MTYEIVIERKALKFINKQSQDQKRRILAAIYRLPEGTDITKLASKDELYRLRVGDYRILYTVDNGKLIVYVIDAGNRGQIYKRY